MTETGARFAVLGAHGMLGRALVEDLTHRGERPVARDIQDLDVTDAAAVERFFKSERPEIVLNATGYTDVDGAETDAESCGRVNAIAPGLLAEAARKRGALLVHVSTDYVFDGSKAAPYTEDDVAGPRGPLSVYGRTKLAGERAVRDSGARHLIVRTAWMFAPWGRNFVLRIIQLAREKGQLRVVDDQTGSPTYAPDVARATVELALTGSSGKIEGTFNVVNSGAATWFDLAGEACALAVEAGVLGERTYGISGIPTSEYPTAAARPEYSVLSTAKLERTLGRPLRPWKDALGECIGRAFPKGA